MNTPFNEQTAAGDFFVGREDRIKQFENYLAGLKNKNPNHMYVVGVNGTAKTSYLQKLSDIASKENLLTIERFTRDNKLKLL
jgi:signal recognition particle GTPase